MQAIIVDDEKHCRDLLQLLLEKHCPEVTVQAICSNGEIALEAIEKYKPQLLFLDVEMPGMDGFQMLEACVKPAFEVIFTTAYNQYAIPAIRHSALDYLLKPIDTEELIAAVNKATTQRIDHSQQKITNLLEFLQTHLQQGERLAMPTVDGLRMMPIKDILYCESEAAYTRFYLQGEEKPVLIYRSMKDVEEMLNDKGFFRVHNSYLVNLFFMDKYIKGDGGEIIMSDGHSVPVSRQRKQDFLMRIEKM
jgi:two-component system LytT family response regulator